MGPGITGRDISLTNGEEQAFGRGSQFDFPLRFSIGESTSLTEALSMISHQTDKEKTNV